MGKITLSRLRQAQRSQRRSRGAQGTSQWFYSQSTVSSLLQVVSGFYDLRPTANHNVIY